MHEAVAAFVIVPMLQKRCMRLKAMQIKWCMPGRILKNFVYEKHGVSMAHQAQVLEANMQSLAQLPVANDLVHLHINDIPVHVGHNTRTAVVKQYGIPFWTEGSTPMST